MLTGLINHLKQAQKFLAVSQADFDDFCRPDAIWQAKLKLPSGASFQSFRVQHNNHYGPYKGGLRFSPTVTAADSQALAILMSLKNSCLGLPLGGAKGGIQVDPGQLEPAELELLARQYVGKFKDHLGPEIDIPAPDMNTNPAIIDIMADEYQQLTGDSRQAAFTGKSVNAGGSAGRLAATGRGGALVLAEFLKLTQGARAGDRRQRLSLHGFGNAGSHLAQVVARDYPDWAITAVADISGAYLSKDRSELPVSALIEHQRDQGSLAGFEHPNVVTIDLDDFWSLPVDILVLAAVENSLNAGNQQLVGASLILEIANNPITPEADLALNQRGVRIIPDLIGSGGGVIVSYLEVCQNLARQHWSEAVVNDHLATLIGATALSVYQLAQSQNLSWRQAGFVYGLKQFFANPLTLTAPLTASQQLLPPVYSQNNQQPGVDWVGAPGQAVHALADGRVIASRATDNGHQLIIEHRWGIHSIYEELARQTRPLLAVGDSVQTGQKIGRIKKTGRSDRQPAKFHLEIHRHYQPVDPKPYLPG